MWKRWTFYFILIFWTNLLIYNTIIFFVMSNSIRQTQFHRSVRDMRLAYSNLMYVFNPRRNIVFTWYEILAGISILSFLSFLVFLVIYYALWSICKEPPFSAALCNKLTFQYYFRHIIELSAHSNSSETYSSFPNNKNPAFLSQPHSTYAFSVQNGWNSMLR